MGNKLSGGQKQRISIARALAKKPQILILDEPTSSLDSKSEQLIQNSIERISKNITTIIVAHRLSTIVDCDCILVVDEGKIVEKGRHDELIRLGGIYYRMWTRQVHEEKKKSSASEGTLSATAPIRSSGSLRSRHH